MLKYNLKYNGRHPIVGGKGGSGLWARKQVRMDATIAIIGGLKPGMLSKELSIDHKHSWGTVESEHLDTNPFSHSLKICFIMLSEFKYLVTMTAIIKEECSLSNIAQSLPNAAIVSNLATRQQNAY